MEKEYQLQIVDVLGKEHRSVLKFNTTQNTKELAQKILDEADKHKWFYLEDDNTFIKYDNVVRVNVMEYKEIDVGSITF
ncbi:hypothetical protein BU041_04475 [Staphylococcus simulans]|uniref:hypothetical protein n=1 Tax=Staphylococcus simulans TaxID=1286 RepID=UPI000E686C10|nr:hypothetical protein [Staphylococcus simulans]RIN52081.1 hypothetical protein BU041_04475 [Staphylococcus simulans]